MPNAASTLRVCAVLAVGVLLSAPDAMARQPNEGAVITGTVTDRDNTRVMGTVYAPDGTALSNVNIWVVNDDAPARRQRTKTRKTGTYLARNLTPLLEDFNLEGINLRLIFEKDGYQSVETTVGVARNSLGTVHPILWPNGAAPEASGVYAVLTGRVVGPNGKPAKGAKVRIGSPGTDLALETEVDKDGIYELLLWEAPRVVRLDVTAPDSAPWSQEVSLAEQTRPDLLQVASFDVELEG